MSDNRDVILEMGDTLRAAVDLLHRCDGMLYIINRMHTLSGVSAPAGFHKLVGDLREFLK